MFATFRSGAWLTADRVRVYPILVGSAFALAAVALLATSHGVADAFGRPIGVDFSGIWVAGREVLSGHPSRPYDHGAHAAAQAAAFGTVDMFLPWPYPPYFLAIAGVLARLPYLAALAFWQCATSALYLGAVALAVRGSRSPRRDLFQAALFFPAVAINAMHGQNGCLTAALLGAGGLLLPRFPLAAGIAFGLLVYKPQFALMWPLALLAGRHWRALAAAATTIAGLTMATVWAFGMVPWRAFVAELPWTRVVVLEGGGLESFKLESAFAAVRLVGGTVAQAYVFQVAVALIAGGTLVFIWSRRLDHRVKYAALVSASLLATPYCVDYDLASLGPALAALVALGASRGFDPFEKSLLALVWAMPLAARIVAVTLHLPLGFLCLVALHLILVARARPSARRSRSRDLAEGMSDDADRAARSPMPSPGGEIQSATAPRPRSAAHA